ncbi:hypothetical protein M9Y10_009718 [Tritrichomonas musculus]|uniref:SAC domain-containing protein n=1 Tax=Tritrichomonas musculus TaxID=1915356 RepID=A0ABR2IP42_9EUKA
MSSSPVSLFDSPKLQTAYLIVSAEPISSNKTYVFSIDKNTGGIYHAGIPNIDIFSNQESASQYLSSIFNIEINSNKKVGNNQPNFKGIGQSLIGATIYEEKDTMTKQLVIVCVQDHEVITTLFNQPIYKILEVSYTFFELNPKSVLSTSTQSYLHFNSFNQLLKSKQITRKDSFLNFDLRNNHFYCPTLDMNSHFPYPQNIISNGSFCWNKRFLIPFEENNCIKACIIVLQGGVYKYDQSPNASITYVVKRSSMFPGTRYNARGLKVTSSKIVEPANECECELIFSDGNYYYSQTWRRGSPPLFWKTESGLLTASHVLSSNASEMTPIYFYQHIIKRFRSSRIHIVSLLSNKEGSHERSFNDAYEQGVRKVLFTTNLSNLNDDGHETVGFNFSRFDINNLLSNHDTNAIASTFFKMLQDDVSCSNFTKVSIETGIIEGNDDDIYSPSQLNQNENDENITSSDPTDILVKKLNFDIIPIDTPNKQSVIFRFNCADSLDRTNVGTFFYSVLITAKYAFQNNISSFLTEGSSQSNTDSTDLWKNPLSYLNQQVIDFLIDSFVTSGNVISQLYTDTNAIKSQVIKDTQAVGAPASTSNYSLSLWHIDDFMISFLRRCKNTFSDPIRQHSIEEWTRTFKLKNPRFVLDQQHIAICHSHLNGEDKSSYKIDHSIFEINEKDFVLSSSKDIVAMFPEPLFLYQISFLVLRRNINENVTMTLRIGNDNRSSSIFFKDLLIPIITDKNASKSRNENDCFVWVTYNLRKIAKYSNMFPVEPESLRPALFVSIRFECPNKQIHQWKRNFRIGNIKFVVKKPSTSYLFNFSNPMIKKNNNNNDQSENISKHRYILTGKPVPVNGVHLDQRIKKIYDKTFSSFKNYFDNSKNANNRSGSFLSKLIHSGSSEYYMDMSSLPEMGELMMTMMRWIKYGISDYNRYSEMVKHKANPWVFDLSSRMHSQNDPNKCPFCGRKTKAEEIINKLKLIKEEQNSNKKNNNANNNNNNLNDRELLRKSTVYMPNPVFPLFYIKTINSDSILNNTNNVTFLCEECSKYYNDLINYENKKYKAKQSKNKKQDVDNENNNNNIISSINDDEETDDYMNENDLGDTGNEDEDDLTAQSNIISSHIDNFVNISDISDVQQSYLPAFFNSNFCHFDDIPVPLNLNEMGRIYDSPSKTPTKNLTAALYASFLPQQPNNDDSCAHIVGNFAEFSVCFVASVNPTEVNFLLNEPLKNPFDFIVNVPGVKENVATLSSSPSSSKQLSYEIKIPKHTSGNVRYIQSMIFKFKPKSDKKSEKSSLDISLKMINITGFIEKVRPNNLNLNYNENDNSNNPIYIASSDNYNVNDDDEDLDSLDSLNSSKEVFQLPKFNLTKNGEWNMILRNQSFHVPDSFPCNFKVYGVAISISQKKFIGGIPQSIIICFYKKNTLVHMVPIILPSDVSEMGYIDRGDKNQSQGPGVWISSLFSSSPQMDCFYFPISNIVYNRFDFDNVNVFYIGRTTSVNPLNIMFF